MAKPSKTSLARRTCRLAERAFHASARLLDQLGYPTGATQPGVAEDLSASELAIAVTLLSGELFECGISPEIG